ncbi:MAG: hypothetical protein KKF02_09400, partial [Proteobacteria bacterium]|nr:hypothetical protein [Pseudomonadota bacterium]
LLSRRLMKKSKGCGAMGENFRVAVEAGRGQRAEGGLKSFSGRIDLSGFFDQNQAGSSKLN